jgi:hypothetical protein
MGEPDELAKYNDYLNTLQQRDGAKNQEKQ